MSKNTFFLDAPYFEQGNNVTILQQFYKGKDGTLDCSVLMANPQIMPLKFTNTSKNSSNVHTKVRTYSKQLYITHFSKNTF